MADIQHYERVLKGARGAKAIIPKLLMLLLYLVVLGFWTVLAFVTAFNATVLVLAPLTLLALILPTWKYTSVEYEYSFVAGTFTFSKVFGKSRIRQVIECDLKMLVSVRPLQASNMPTKENGRIIDALPGKAEFPIVCIFEDGNKNKYYILMDCDSVTARIFKFFKMSALDHQVSRRATVS